MVVNNYSQEVPIIRSLVAAVPINLSINSLCDVLLKIEELFAFPKCPTLACDQIIGQLKSPPHIILHHMDLTDDDHTLYGPEGGGRAA